MEIQSTRVETKLLVGHSAHNTSSLPDSRFLSKGCSSQEQDLLLWKKDLTPGAPPSVPPSSSRLRGLWLKSKS